MSDTSLYSENTPDPAVKKQDKNVITKPAEPTLLDRLRTTISQKVERTAVYLEVPERPGVTLKISPNISQHDMRRWRKACGEESKNGLDATKFGCYVIGHTTIGICIDGEEVLDADGYPLGFASEEVLAMTETTKALPDCVREFFGVDPHIESAALAILDASGYGDTVDTVDPTQGS
jgi:hypothetical protein